MGEQSRQVGAIGVLQFQDQIARGVVIEAGRARPVKGAWPGEAGGATLADIVFERRAAAVAKRLGDELDP